MGLLTFGNGIIIEQEREISKGGEGNHAGGNQRTLVSQVHKRFVYLLRAADFKAESQGLALTAGYSARLSRQLVKGHRAGRRHI